MYAGIEDSSYVVYELIAQAYLGDSKNSGDFDEMFPGLIDVK